MLAALVNRVRRWLFGRDLGVWYVLGYRLPLGYVGSGTLEAAREMLSPANRRRVGRRALNLLGGFHHARPDVAAGFCPVNDIAVAVAAAREEGFQGRVLVLDLDAHPPDGTAACLFEKG